jgi:cobalt-zinc-cadmium efflux system protein
MSRSPHDIDDLDQNRRKKNALRIAIALSLFAFVFQLLGAFFTGSLALLGDTAHVFTDMLSLTMSLIAVTLASRPATHARSFGLYRLEVLAAFLNGLLLIAVALGLSWEALHRLQEPTPVLALPLIVVATGGMLVNLLSALLLARAMKGQPHHHPHHHGHGHHEHHHFEGDRNLRGALLHVLSDALGSLAVVVGAVVTYFTDWFWVDPLLALLLAVVILRWSVRLLLDSGHVLLEGTPRHLKVEEIVRSLEEADSRITAVEDLHVWEITSRMYAATAEIRAGKMSLEEADELRIRLVELLKNRFGISHSVLALRP